MKYVSSRGLAPALEFDDVLLTGLARDGGLYLPEEWPFFTTQEIRDLRGLSYAELAAKIMAPFMEGSVLAADLEGLCAKTYAPFCHPATAPLVQLDTGLWVMELFHGPTLAFKDYALQAVGHMFDGVLTARGSRVTIVGATSGDTGSAAIEGCKNRPAIDIFILHPKGRVSDVQRRQMTTVVADNVHNIALEGNFDDCQNMVKAMFNDLAFRDEVSLSAVNSINWARIMAQVVYYFRAGLELGAPDRPFAVSVPTGNFGNVFAGYVAMKMGLPIEKFVVGSNANDILTRFFNTGSMTAAEVVGTTSPSMDIGISSNFERLLFEACDRDGAAVKAMMDGFAQSGSYTVPEKVFETIGALFTGSRYDDAQVAGVIGKTWRDAGYLLDPHSAIGVAAAENADIPADLPVVCLATAHPAKFPDAVRAACGQTPDLPARVADLFEKPEHMTEQPNDLPLMQDFVRSHRRSGTPA